MKRRIAMGHVLSLLDAFEDFLTTLDYFLDPSADPEAASAFLSALPKRVTEELCLLAGWERALLVEVEDLH